MTIWITSGDRPSGGRVALQQAGGFRRYVRGVSKERIGDRVINWGCSSPIGTLLPVHNTPNFIALAANKLAAFRKFTENSISVVPWTTSKNDVMEWLKTSSVVARTKLTGHSGEGIIIIEKGSSQIPDAPLYTKYITKTHEYRVHVANNVVIDVQRKIRDPNREPTDWKVRSHENGFIFARNNVEIGQNVGELSTSAVQSLGLDFGAVDIILDKSGKTYVLEINTAPGLEGQTVQSYVKALKEMCGGS